MKLTQFYKNNVPALGIWTDRGVVDPAVEAARRGLTAPATMLEAIRGGEDALRLLETLADGPAVENPTLAPVVTGMDKILCIGFNYRQHIAECAKPIPNAPALFNKFHSALAAHGQAIFLPRDYREHDYEGELVAVIGKPARNVPAERALDYVFGCTCGNDLSTRDLQFARSGQWLMGKTFDGFAPVGPCVAVGLDPRDLALSTAVNGELRQNARTSDLIFDVAHIIADLSRHFTLLPGDLLFTGTPEGVMQGYPADQKRWLQPGDRVDVTIEGIGTLSNTFI